MTTRPVVLAGRANTITAAVFGTCPDAVDGATEEEKDGKRCGWRPRAELTSDALSAYDGALEGGASDFRGFFACFREAEDILNQHLARGEKEEAARSPVYCVRQAIEKFYPDVTDLRVERGPVRMTLLHRGTRLDVAQLSDGEKCLLALIGDLARRMVLASPPGCDPLQSPARSAGGRVNSVFVSLSFRSANVGAGERKTVSRRA